MTLQIPAQVVSVSLILEERSKQFGLGQEMQEVYLVQASRMDATRRVKSSGTLI